MRRHLRNPPGRDVRIPPPQIPHPIRPRLPDLPNPLETRPLPRHRTPPLRNELRGKRDPLPNPSQKLHPESHKESLPPLRKIPAPTPQQLSPPPPPPPPP